MNQNIKTNNNFLNTIPLRSLLKFAQKPLIFACFLNKFAQVQERPVKKWIAIIGPPRTGSTLLYQLLAHSKKLGYLSNADYFLYRIPFLFQSKLISKFKLCYKTDYSSEIGFEKGLGAPSEANLFWKYWFGYTLEEKEVLYQFKRKTMGKLALASIAHPETGLIVTGWNAHLFYTHDITRDFPATSFLVVLRDPVDVAISILKARVEAFKKISRWWSLKPNEIKESDGNVSPIEEVVLQVYYLYWRCEYVFQEHPDRVCLIDYQRICNDPRNVVSELGYSMGIELNSLPPRLKFIPSVGNDYGGYRSEVKTLVRSLDWPSWLTRIFL